MVATVWAYYEEKRGSSTYHETSKPVEIPIYKKYAIPIPHPVAVPVAQQIKVPIPQPYEVHVAVPHPVPIEVVKHVEIPVERPEPYIIEKKVFINTHIFNNCVIIYKSCIFTCRNFKAPTDQREICAIYV